MRSFQLTFFFSFFPSLSLSLSSQKQDPGSMLARMFSGDMPSSRLDSKVSWRLGEKKR